MPLGLEDGRVPDPLIRASSYYNYYCGPFNARLNRRRYGRQGGAWCAKRRDRRQWLQVDFGALTRVSRVATQGRQNAAQWVTSYYISYSRNGYKFVPYREGRRTKVMIFRCAWFSRCRRNEAAAFIITGDALSIWDLAFLVVCLVVYLYKDGHKKCYASRHLTVYWLLEDE